MTLAKVPDKTTTARRRSRSFVAVAACARPTLAEAAAGRGFAQPEVLTRWAEIVGDHLAGLCLPVKVTYACERSFGATLIVRVEGARAPEVELLAPRILERINQFYGYRAIARVRLTQTGPAASFAAPRAACAPAAAPGPAEAQEAAELARGIEDACLRAALTRLGAHVLARRRAPR